MISLKSDTMISKSDPIDGKIGAYSIHPYSWDPAVHSDPLVDQPSNSSNSTSSAIPTEFNLANLPYSISALTLGAYSKPSSARSHSQPDSQSSPWFDIDNSYSRNQNVLQSNPSIQSPQYDQHGQPDMNPKPQSLADQVFGRQLEQGYLTVFQESQAARARLRLHDQHLREMDQWHSDLMNQLSVAQRPYNLASTPQQVAQLEKLILQLESERRKSELDVWKDIFEIQEKHLESKFKYLALRERYGILAGLEHADA